MRQPYFFKHIVLLTMIIIDYANELGAENSDNQLAVSAIYNLKKANADFVEKNYTKSVESSVAVIRSNFSEWNNNERSVVNDSSSIRRKRQVIYYICGRYPHQFYSTTACPRCVNNGQDLNLECTSGVQCVTLYGGITACVNGRCCTADDSGIIDGNYPQYDPNSPFSPANPPSPLIPHNPYDPTLGTGNSITYGYCSKGERSNIRCAAAGQCPIQQLCLNGLCCPRSANDYAHACGGQMALGVCEGGICPPGLTCIPSNFCCQCPAGRSGGRCNQGVCAPGYRCDINGYCCAACPNRTTPYGECADGKACGGGAQCQTAGELCCFPP